MTRDNEKEFARYFGIKLQEWRTLRGLTQRELGEKASISEGQIRKYEAGLQCPTAYGCFWLMKALEISPMELVNWTDEEKAKYAEAFQCSVLVRRRQILDVMIILTDRVRALIEESEPAQTTLNK
ncbi:MAG: helix-turn-helix transcriptional regulator [Lachnospiraceae bacterium]|nr:helix-turn-helix transcriptional regulator [Lachnospiraceae bacterium]